MQSRVAILPTARNGEFQVVATDDFQAGEVIIGEEPLIWVPVSNTAYRFAWGLVDQLLASREKLTEVERWALKQSPSPEYDEQDVRIEKNLARGANKKREVIRSLFQIMVTNNIATLDFAGNVTGFGLFRTLSRTNHSCDPNASLQAGTQSICQVQLVAKRLISCNEPVTWCYAGGHHENRFLALDCRLRQQMLRRDFGFECWCARCDEESQKGF